MKTEKVIVQSVQNNRCPYCNSRNITYENSDSDGGNTWYEWEIFCDDCKRYFTAEFSMEFKGIRVGTKDTEAVVGMEVEVNTYK